MSKFSEIKTKAAKIAFLREQLEKNDRWMLKGLHTIFQYQTESEQRAATTTDHNGVGFTGIDGEILTSFTVQAVRRGLLDALSNPNDFHATKFLTTPQLNILRKKMPKYAKQLLRIAEEKEALLKHAKERSHSMESEMEASAH